MKKQILSFLFVLSAALLISTSAFAQPSTPILDHPVVALDNMSSTFTPTVSSAGAKTYTWALSTITGGTRNGTSTKAAVNATTAGTVTFNWNDAQAGDVYQLDVYYKDDVTNCWSEKLRYTITIKSAELFVTASQSSTTCSWLGSANVKGNVNAAADLVTILVTTDGGIAPIAITYSIMNGATTVASGLTSSVASLTGSANPYSGSFDIPITSNFNNTSGSPVTYTIEVTGATDKDGNPLTINGTLKTSSVVINSTPTITF